jgi:hypothetical protein
MSNSASISLVTRAFTKAEIPLPKEIREAISRADRTRTALGELSSQRVDLAGALVSAVASGKGDPFEDPHLSRAVTQHVLITQNVYANAETSVTEQVASEFILHTEKLLGALARKYKQAATDLESAHEVLGDTSLDQTVAVLNQGAAASVAWGSAQAATGVIGHLVEGWKFVAMLNNKQIAKRDLVFVLAPVDYDTYQSQGWRNDTPTPWDLVRAGCHLDMATSLAELEQRSAVVLSGVEQDRREQEQHERNAVRTHLGTGPA